MKFNSGLATPFWEEGMEEIWTGENFPMNYRTAFLNHFLSSDSEYGEYPWHVGILSSLGQVIYKLNEYGSHVLHIGWLP